MIRISEHTFDAVILADGDFPRSETALEILHHAGFLCCCDGAGQKLIERGIMPDAIVGDGDSLPADFKEKYKDIIHLVSEQEYNDMTKCTKYILGNEELSYVNSSNKDEVNQILHSSLFTLHSNVALHSSLRLAYLGCTGKREDHTLGNISLMAFYQKEFGIEPYMFTDYGVFIPGHGTQSFESAPHLQVSIFNIDSKVLSSEGLKWEAYPYSQLWQGTLNEAISDSFTIHADGSYIIYVTYLPKL